MIKLNYTEEMKEQDKLWRYENENLEIMKKLYENIISEAREIGFNGFSNVYICNGECICEIYDTEEEYKNGNDTEFIFGFCEPLIECLEKYYLN